MSDLEKKLKELDLEFLHGVPVRLNTEMIEEIKQAFIDAGWFTPSDRELVQQVMNFRTQRKQHDYVGPDTILPHVSRTPEEIEAISKEWSKPRMTGQEWYDRFSRSLLKGSLEYAHKTSKLTAILGEGCIKQSDVMRAAKKAAGIE